MSVIGLVRGAQEADRQLQRSSDIHHVSQSIFPAFRSTGGPDVSPAALAAAVARNSPCLGTGLCPEHRRAGDFLPGRIKCRRNRTVFTEQHLSQLERSFEQQKYLSSRERAALAGRLGLSQLQVKTWYQNRRMKWKKQVCSLSPP